MSQSLTPQQNKPNQVIMPASYKDALCSHISQNEITEQQNEITEQQNEITEQQNEITEQQNEITEQQNEITEQQNKITEQQNKITEQQNEITEQQKELEILRKKNAKQLNTLKIFQRQNNTLKNKLNIQEQTYCSEFYQLNQAHIYELNLMHQNYLYDINQIKYNHMQEIESLKQLLAKEKQRFHDFANCLPILAFGFS